MTGGQAIWRIHAGPTARRSVLGPVRTAASLVIGGKYQGELSIENIHCDEYKAQEIVCYLV